MFFDRAKIYVEAGNGGNGVVAFRREKFVPRGGPAGGNGGRGGNVYFVVDPSLNTLSAFQKKVHHRADRGTHGSGSDKTGARGEDCRIMVPPGTMIRDAETDDLLADLTHAEQEVLIAAGGRGGRGNKAFKSSRNQAPRLAENGEPGEERWLKMELKLVADVGIIGVPNAGKSTLLSVVSAAKPEIAAYPFTTIVPNLGVAELDYRQMVLADIPGLMEGAHQGIGLGIDFLRHIERTRILIHVLSGDSPDPLGDFEAINQELRLFNPALAHKPQVVVFNKMDLPDAQELWPLIEEAIQAEDLTVMNISAVARQNLNPLLYKVQEMLDALPPPEAAPLDILPNIEPAEPDNTFQIAQVDTYIWQVEGRAIERAVHMTNWDYYESALRFQRILQAMGIADALRKDGIEEGDTVRIGEFEMVWGYENALDE